MHIYMYIYIYIYIYTLYSLLRIFYKQHQDEIGKESSKI